MKDCAPIRPLLYDVAEGEATPRETMIVARHLTECTACRILLARERRLAQMLEKELQDAQVEEGFVHCVMDRLPDCPPPPKPARKARRGLRLAAIGGMIGGCVLLASTGTTPPGGWEQGPGLEIGVGDGGGWSVAQTTLAALRSMAADLNPHFVQLGMGLSLGAGLMLSTLALMATGSFALAMAAGALFRAPR